MPYTIKTKDGITVAGIPDDVAKDDARLRELVAQLRASGQTSGTFATPAAPAEVVPAVPAAVPAAPQMGVAELARAAEEEMSGLRSPALYEKDPFLYELRNNLGVAARGVAQGLASPVTMFADPITRLINLALPPEAQQLPPSEGLSLILTKLGVPEAQTKAQEILQATAAGAGAAGAGVGVGSALSGMPGLVGGVGKTLAAQPAAQIAGGAASEGASKTAEELGAGPLVQLGAGIAAGAVGSRLASVEPALKTAASALDEDIGNTIRKASAGDKAARQKIADLAAINPQAKEAAQRLEIELPADIFSDNPQIRAAAGLGRSVQGGYEASAWRNTVSKALDRADDVLEGFGATFVEGAPAPAVVSARVKDTMLNTRKTLHDTAVDLYRQIDDVVPKSSPATFTRTGEELARIVEEVGEAGLSPQEKKLLEMIGDKASTYGRLIREKNLLGQALQRKDSPYSNMEAGALKRLYGAMAEDQLASVRTIGNAELEQKLIAANALYAKERDLGSKIVDLFGKDRMGSIADKMRGAITGAAKGDTKAFGQLVDSIPPELQKETVATAIASVARTRSAADAGAFGAAEYVKMYQGMRANPEVYKRVASILGPESSGYLRDLYEVSKRITDARANVLTTGKANQALLQGITAQNLVEKIIGSTIGRSAASASGAVIGGALGGGMVGSGVGAGLSNAIVESLTRGEKTKLEAVGTLFRSKQFQDLLAATVANDTITPAQARALAQTEAFKKFAKTVRLPEITDYLDSWIISAAIPKESPKASPAGAPARKE